MHHYLGPELAQWTASFWSIFSGLASSCNVSLALRVHQFLVTRVLSHSWTSSMYLACNYLAVALSCVCSQQGNKNTKQKHNIWPHQSPPTHTCVIQLPDRSLFVFLYFSAAFPLFVSAPASPTASPAFLLGFSSSPAMLPYLEEWAWRNHVKSPCMQTSFGNEVQTKPLSLSKSIVTSANINLTCNSQTYKLFNKCNSLFK